MLLNLPVFQVQNLLRESSGEPNNKALPLNISNKTSITCVRKSVSLVVMSLLSTNTVEFPPPPNTAYSCLASQDYIFMFKIIIPCPLPIYSRYCIVLQYIHFISVHIICLPFKMLPHKLQHPTLTIHSCRCDLQ